MHTRVCKSRFHPCRVRKGELWLKCLLMMSFSVVCSFKANETSRDRGCYLSQISTGPGGSHRCFSYRKFVPTQRGAIATCSLVFFGFEKPSSPVLAKYRRRSSPHPVPLSVFKQSESNRVGLDWIGIASKPQPE